jgi:hypothetical protein
MALHELCRHGDYQCVLIWLSGCRGVTFSAVYWQRVVIYRSSGQYAVGIGVNAVSSSVDGKRAGAAGKRSGKEQRVERGGEGAVEGFEEERKEAELRGRLHVSLTPDVNLAIA